MAHRIRTLALAALVLPACAPTVGAEEDTAEGDETGTASGTSSSDGVGATNSAVDDTASTGGAGEDDTAADEDDTAGGGEDEGDGTEDDGPSACGDGVVDADEQCDDEGPSETCTVTCTWVPGSIVWSVDEPTFVPGGLARHDDRLWAVGSTQISLDGFQTEPAFAAAYLYNLDGGTELVSDFHGFDEPALGNAVFVDELDRVFVAGNTGWPIPPLSTPSVAGLWQLDGNGQTVWQQPVGVVPPPDTPGLYLAQSLGVVADADRVTVAATVLTSQSNWLVQQHDTSGAVVWSEENADLSGARAVALMGDGSLVVAGTSGSGAVVRRLSPGGDEQWTANFFQAAVADVEVGDESLILAGGESTGWIRAVSFDGVVLWTKNVAADEVGAVAIDESGNLSVIGVDSGGTSLVLLEVDGEPLTADEEMRGGEEPLWSLTVEGLGNARAADLVIDADGRLFAAGLLGTVAGTPLGWVGQIGG